MDTGVGAAEREQEDAAVGERDGEGVGGGSEPHRAAVGRAGGRDQLGPRAGPRVAHEVEAAAERTDVLQQGERGSVEEVSTDRGRERERERRGEEMWKRRKILDFETNVMQLSFSGL